MTLNRSSINAKTMTGIAIVSMMIVLMSWMALHQSQHNNTAQKKFVVLVEDM